MVMIRVNRDRVTLKQCFSCMWHFNSFSSSACLSSSVFFQSETNPSIENKFLRVHVNIIIFCAVWSSVNRFTLSETTWSQQTLLWTEGLQSVITQVYRNWQCFCFNFIFNCLIHVSTRPYGHQGVTLCSSLSNGISCWKLKLIRCSSSLQHHLIILLSGTFKYVDYSL